MTGTAHDLPAPADKVPAEQAPGEQAPAERLPPGPAPAARFPVEKVIVLDDLGPRRVDAIRPQVRLAYACLVPAVVVLGYLVAWPTVRTVARAFTDGCRSGVCLDNVTAVFADHQSSAALLRTLIWALGLPLVMVVGGFLLGLVLSPLRGRVVAALLVLPMAVPMLATGVAFRLLYDPDPDRSVLALLLRPLSVFGYHWQSPLRANMITFALIPAFLWSYLGLSATVFRRVLAAIPVEQEAAIGAEGGGLRHVVRWLYWPVLRRVALLLAAVTGLFSARAFDLLLAMAPGSSQPAGEVVALHVWRYGDASSGPTAALGTLWLGVLIVVVVIGPLVSFSARWRMPPTDEQSRAVHGLRTSTPKWRRLRIPRWVGRIAGGVIGVLWSLPAGMLVFAALHDSAGFAVHGLAAPLGAPLTDTQLGLDWPDLVTSLISTLLLAAVAALIATAVAGLAAYSLGWLRPPGRGLILAVVLVCAAVPVQAITDPLVRALSGIGLTGSWWALLAVHVALGVGLTTVLLYGTFGGLSPEQLRASRVGDPGQQSDPIRVVLHSVLPNLAAAFALQFLQVWNDLVVGLLFAPGGVAPLGMALLGDLRYFTTDTPDIAALLVIYAAVPLTVVAIGARGIVRLLMAGVTGNWAVRPDTP